MLLGPINPPQPDYGHDKGDALYAVELTLGFEKVCPCRRMDAFCRMSRAPSNCYVPPCMQLASTNRHVCQSVDLTSAFPQCS